MSSTSLPPDSLLEHPERLHGVNECLTAAGHLRAYSSVVLVTGSLGCRCQDWLSETCIRVHISITYILLEASVLAAYLRDKEGFNALVDIEAVLLHLFIDIGVHLLIQRIVLVLP